MIGIDTSFLVAFELAEHPKHDLARTFALERYKEGFALAPQVLTEFLHIVTDERRFQNPLSMPAAVTLAERWRDAVEVCLTPAGQEACTVFTSLLSEYRLGRKRLLDTMLAATYLAAEVRIVVTLDARDFARFTGFAPIVL